MNCQAPSCTNSAVVQWQRRPTDAELAQIVALAQAQQDLILASADPANPPSLPPLPDGTNTVVAVYACGTHAISADLAADIHQSACTAPPTCNCTPEAPTFVAPSVVKQDSPAMPAGW